MSQSEPLAKQKYTITDKTSTCKLCESQIMSYCGKPNKYHFPSILFIKMFQNTILHNDGTKEALRALPYNSTVHPHQ